jgi:hypothetical protein
MRGACGREGQRVSFWHQTVRLIGVDRKWSAGRQTGAFDPQETFQAI